MKHKTELDGKNRPDPSQVNIFLKTTLAALTEGRRNNIQAKLTRINVINMRNGFNLPNKTVVAYLPLGSNLSFSLYIATSHAYPPTE